MIDNPLTSLRQFIANHYRLTEFKTLCLDLHVDYDELGPEAKKSVKVYELLYLLGQLRHYDALLIALRRDRPKAFVEEGLEKMTPQALLEALPGFGSDPVGGSRRTKIKSDNKSYGISDRYQKEEEIGRGSFAVVFKAWDTVLERVVALKVLHPYWQDKPEFVRRFNLEAKMAASLQHANILRIFDSGKDEEGGLFMVMEYLPGKTLRAYLETHGVLILEKALPILEQIASSLDYAHERGIVHRDVKPGNIMLKEDKSGLKVYLTDFGLVKAMEGTLAETMTVQATNLGSPEYMAPEQADPNRGDEVGPAADRYAFGVLAYRLLTGRVPFAGNPNAVLYAHEYKPPPLPRDIQPGLSKAAEIALLKMMAKDPDKRFSSCQSFVAAFSASSPIDSSELLARRPLNLDNLTIIKGIGPVFASRLNKAGIYNFGQLASLTPEMIESISDVTRSRASDWMEQARQLTLEPLKSDKLTVIKGIGPVYEKRLNQAKIFTYAQLAAQTPGKVQDITRSTLKKARNWIAQARKLTSTPMIPDNLTIIKGIGSVTAMRLNQAGIFTFDQLAAMNPERVRAITKATRWDPKVWIKEARRLASGE